MRQLLSEIDAIKEPKRKGDAFERVTKWVLQNAPLYSTQLKNVWLWDEFPRSWGPDTGIDLVAEPVEGKLWAVQSKAYPSDISVSWRDISTFVGASAARPEIGSLLLVTTAGDVGRNARRNLDVCGKPVTILTRESLLSLGLQDTSLAELRPKRLERYRPRPHQSEAIKLVTTGFKKHARGQMIHPCGTGKTLTALWIHERLKSSRTVIFVPSLALLAQTLREWTRHAASPFVALAVCSDKTVTDPDPWVASATEVGLPATTDAKALRAALKRHDEVVVFATYQSSQVVEEALKYTKINFDLLICDEAHRASGLGGTDFTRPLKQGSIRAERRLFMTATPRVYGTRSKKAAAEEDLPLWSMDDASQYGPSFQTLSFSEAINRDPPLLADYRVVIVGVNDEEVAKLAKERRFVTHDGDEVIPASELGAHIAIAKTMRRFSSRRMITFHTYVKRAERFARAFPGVVEWIGSRRAPGGEIWADAVKGSMPIRRRSVILRRLAGVGEGEYGLVSNARCLGEGVDVPTIDGIAFVDPKSSPVDIVQAVGRAIRLPAGDPTKTATIVLPVFIGPEEDAEEVAKGSDFRAVWRVLEALRAHDDALAEELDAIRRGLGRGEPRAGLPPKIILDVPKSVGTGFADAISVRLVEQTTAAWEYGFGKLQTYVEENGTARVHPNHRDPTDGFRLGGWVRRQRYEHLTNRLGPERTTLIGSLPGWIWSRSAANFEEGLKALDSFIAREGHARVPTAHVEEGFRLGQWVHNRQAYYLVGRVPAWQIEELEARPEWVWDLMAARLEAWLELLRQYVEREGDALVPGKHKEAGHKLGQWVNGRRTDYQRGKLDKGLARQLEALPGWSWTPRKESHRPYLAALDRFIAREGHALVQATHVEGKVNLGAWVSNQRAQYKRGRLEKDRIRDLERRRGWSWDPREDSYRQHLAALDSFVAREGHALVPSNHLEAGLKLGSWIQVKRQEFRKETLDQARIKDLEARKGWVWDARKASGQV